MAAQGLENYLWDCHKVGIYKETRLNLLTSHLLVKLGFLDSNLLRTFGGTNEVGFGRSLARFKALEVSYNFPRNSLLQKTYGFFWIPKIPLKGQNCQKWNLSKMIPKWHSSIFSFQTPSKQSQNHQNFRIWSLMLKIHQGFKKYDLPFWCEMTILPLVLLLYNFRPLSILIT